ncbi:MAG: ribulose-phosphate 3-epimerase [Gemmatimonadota bacterium]
MTAIRIAPSILSADFGRLAEEVVRAQEAGADWIHVDVMDGHFVPNLTLGPAITAAVRKATHLPVDVHLMIENPGRYIQAFRDAGADVVTVHQEACPHLHRTLASIRESGAQAGLALNPGTPVSAAEEVVQMLDLLLIMSVNPGFGGQSFIPSSPGKVARAHRMLDAAGRPDILLEVDGGVDASTAPLLAAAGASVLVAGSALFRASEGLEIALARMRRAVDHQRGGS